MNVYGALDSSVCVSKVFREKDQMVCKYIIIDFLFQSPKIAMLGSKPGCIK